MIRKFKQNKSAFRVMETLEQRMLLSAAVGAAGGGAGELQALAATFPSEVNIVSPEFSDAWHLYNTGQTLSTPILGPATGAAGADISAPEGWDLTTGSNNVVVAVFDTGIDLTHPDLVNNLWTNPGEIANDGIDNDGNGFIDDVYGWNFLSNSNNVQDTSATGHGTLVSGVIGATGNNGIGTSGVAWNVDIMTLAVGTDAGVNSGAVINAINYVVAMKNAGVNVVAINASYISFGAPSLGEISAIFNAGNAGILYVAAAGNGGTNLDSLVPSGFLPSNMIFVAATNNQDALWSSSNYGPNSVALAAPGVDILSTYKGGLYAVVSGTSFSAPMVTGAAALLASEAPTATMTQIKNAILNSVDVLPNLNGFVATGGRLNVYKALETLIGPQAPTGSFESVDATSAKGWAFDFNAGRQAINVQLIVDGVGYTPVVANQDRPDLVATVGSANHGFNIALPALGAGTHTVQIYAGDFPSSPSVLLGQKTLVIAGGPPTGYLDYADGNFATGWAYAQSAVPSQSIYVQAYIDGVAGPVVLANENRPDLVAVAGSANHGYTIDLSAVSAAFHRLDVYAVNPQTSALTLIGTRTINGNNLPFGYIDVLDENLVAGWAYDAEAGSGAVYVRIAIDSEQPYFVLANEQRSDLQSYLGSTAHGYSFAMPRLTSGVHTVSVEVADPQDAGLVTVGTRQLDYVDAANSHNPFGRLEGLTSTVIVGWAYDPDAGATPINVRVDVDGVPGTILPANGFRQDVQDYLGSGNHQFLGDLSGLSAGTHRIDVYMIDAFSGVPVLLASRLMNYAAPYGYVDRLDAGALWGWAYSPALGTAAATVRIDIDGQYGPVYLANQQRNDLTASLGDPNHAFFLNLPSVSSGVHRVTVTVIDPFTFDAFILADQNVAF